ncbi:MAG: hypothetical protein JW725_02810 [Candidatus Babeliaceae bacterium]|nr:hypothetical protein [Candidatus Babeliaceae bacterium]
MKTAFLNYTALRKNADFRFDPDYAVHPLTQGTINFKARFIPLQNTLEYISSGHTPYLHDVSEGDIDFVTVECIDDLNLNETSLKHITKEQFAQEFKKNRIVKDSVLCTIKRRICKAYPFLEAPLAPMTMNQDVAFLIPKQSMDPAYLATYLCCKVGQLFADRQKTEQMNPYISVANLCQVPIAVLSGVFQKLIRSLFERSLSFNHKSSEAYKAAEINLLRELDLLNWKPKHRLSFIKKYSDMQASSRIDAEYFQPKYEEVIERIIKYKKGYKPLAEIVKVKDKIYLPIDDAAYRYIELANISANGNINGINEVLGKELPTRARRIVSAGDVIVSTIEGSLSSIALITKELDNALCSTGFFVIHSERFNSETLLVLLKSPVGQLQLKKGCSGTILTAISDDEFKRIVLPDLPAGIQNDIKKHITEMYETKVLSKRLLNIAKRGVEMAIEKNEAEAQKWIAATIN